MFYHAILGLLRDGRPRHGYDLILQYRTRSGRPINAGNFYRDCSKLVSNGLIALDANPPEADPRRIPYRITYNGCRDFDAWMFEPKPDQAEFDNWILFADMLPGPERVRLLDEIRETLWALGKELGSTRDRLMARDRRLDASHSYQPARLILLRRIKQIVAELEFLQEVRSELEQAPAGSVQISSRPSDMSPSAAVPSISRFLSVRTDRKAT
jgi:DNA-binding PadR family transcriptional regulator